LVSIKRLGLHLHIADTILSIGVDLIEVLKELIGCFFSLYIIKFCCFLLGF